MILHYVAIGYMSLYILGGTLSLLFGNRLSRAEVIQAISNILFGSIVLMEVLK